MTSLSAFKESFPEITTCEVLITDVNGIARGKWLPIEKINDVLTTGVKLPKSAVSQDIWGRDVPSQCYATGDIDGICQAVEGSLRPRGSSAGVCQAQILLRMFNADGARELGDPRPFLIEI